MSIYSYYCFKDNIWKYRYDMPTLVAKDHKVFKVEYKQIEPTKHEIEDLFGKAEDHCNLDYPEELECLIEGLPECDSLKEYCNMSERCDNLKELKMDEPIIFNLTDSDDESSVDDLFDNVKKFIKDCICYMHGLVKCECDDIDNILEHGDIITKKDLGVNLESHLDNVDDLYTCDTSIKNVNIKSKLDCRYKRVKSQLKELNIDEEEHEDDNDHIILNDGDNEIEDSFNEIMEHIKHNAVTYLPGQWIDDGSVKYYDDTWLDYENTIRRGYPPVEFRPKVETANEYYMKCINIDDEDEFIQDELYDESVNVSSEDELFDQMLNKFITDNLIEIAQNNNQVTDFIKERKYTIGGSEIHKLISLKNTNINTFSKFLYEKKFPEESKNLSKFSKACAHGNMFEPVIRDYILNKHKLTLVDDPYKKIRGTNELEGFSYTPDGIAIDEEGNKVLLEFKCPFSRTVERDENNKRILNEYACQIMSGVELLLHEGMFKLTDYVLFTEAEYEFVDTEPESTGFISIPSYNSSIYNLYIYGDNSKLVYQDNPDVLSYANWYYTLRSYRTVKITCEELLNNPSLYFNRPLKSPLYTLKTKGSKTTKVFTELFTEQSNSILKNPIINKRLKFVHQLLQDPSITSVDIIKDSLLQFLSIEN